MGYRFFRTETTDGVAVVTIDRPPVNAFTLEMALEFGRLVEELASDDGVRAVLLRGGERAFSAGADLEEMKKGGWPYLGELVEAGQRAFRAMEEMPKPVVAAIEGHCLGGGFELALACDRRFMAEGRARVGLPEVRLGLIPAWGTAYRLPRLIGIAAAFDFMARGEMVDAARAKELGIVDEVHPADAVYEKALAYARSLASGATVAIGKIKSMLQRGLAMGFDEVTAMEKAYQEEVFATEDFREGVSAFLEKRKPAFKGR